MKPLAIALLACAAASGSHAEPIYRCGTTYTQTACPQGRLLESSDPRSAADRAAAKTVAASERQQAAAMEHERRVAEAAIKPATAGSLSAAPAPKPAASAPKKASKKKTKKAKTDEAKDFVAIVPGSAKKPANPAAAP